MCRKIPLIKNGQVARLNIKNVLAIWNVKHEFLGGNTPSVFHINHARQIPREEFLHRLTKWKLAWTSHLSSAAEMKPLPSLSKTRKASLISSSESVSFILRAIIVRNSGKSIVPLPASRKPFSTLRACSKRTQKWRACSQWTLRRSKRRTELSAWDVERKVLAAFNVCNAALHEQL